MCIKTFIKKCIKLIQFIKNVLDVLKIEKSKIQNNYKKEKSINISKI